MTDAGGTGEQRLIAWFLSEGATPPVREMICKLVTTRPEMLARHQFTFDRFDLHLDFETATARIEDVLDVSPAGTAPAAR